MKNEPTQIKSSKINLKLFDLGDLNLFTEIYTNQDLMKFIGKPFSNEKAEKRFYQAIKQLKKAQPKYIYYSIIDNETNMTIGVIGIIWNQKNSNSVEIGIILKKQFHGANYAYEATSTLLKHIISLDKISQAIIICQKKNPQAIRVIQKLGFDYQDEFTDKVDKITKIKWVKIIHG